MRFFTSCRSSERCCLPQYIRDTANGDQTRNRRNKRQPADATDVTKFVKRAVDKGQTGLYLLETDSDIIQTLRRTDRPFQMTRDSEKSMEEVKQVTTEEGLPFVIILPDMRMLASRKVSEGDDVVLLAKNEVYWDPDTTEYWSFISWHPSGFGFGSSLSFAEIAEKLLSRFIVVGKDGNGQKKIVENMARLFFSVYDKTDEDEAKKEAQSLMEDKGWNPDTFIKGNGEPWDQELFESLCARLYEQVAADLVEFPIRMYFFGRKAFRSKSITARRLKDLTGVTRTRNTSNVLNYVRASTSVLGYFLGSSAPMPGDIADIVAQGEQDTTIEKKVKDRIRLLGFEGMLNLYQSKLESTSGRNNQSRYIRTDLPEDFKEISKDICNASQRAVRAILEANGFKSPTSNDDHRSETRDVTQNSAATSNTRRDGNCYHCCCCCCCCQSRGNSGDETSAEHNETSDVTQIPAASSTHRGCCCCRRRSPSRGRKSTQTSAEKNGAESSADNSGADSSAANNEAEISADNNEGEISGRNNDSEASAKNNVVEISQDNNRAETPTANNVVEISGTNNDAPSAEEQRLEVKVAYWIMKALTVDVQYRHAAEFLVPTFIPKGKTEYNEKSMADFIWKSPKVESRAMNLEYANTEVKSSDHRDKRCKKYWCSRIAVVAWTIFGPVLYLLFLGLAALSIAVALKSKDNGWEATEVAMNLILTGAVGIFLGTVGFETGNRQVVLGALLWQRAVEELPSAKERPFLQKLVGGQHPEAFVKSNKSDGCTWLAQGGSGWTKLPETVSFEDVAVDGKLFISGYDMSADIFRERKKIFVDEEKILSAGSKPVSPKQKELQDSHGTHVKICNRVK